MRSYFKLAIVCLAAGTVSACQPEKIITTPEIPTAGVRFINAVPDTNLMDFRFVDIVESNVHYRIGFRNGPATTNNVTGSAQIEYKNTQAGQRHLRIFLDGATSDVASTVLVDTTVTIAGGKLYTAMLFGAARTRNMRFVFLEENVPDPAANVGLRFLNVTTAPVEVRTYPATGTVPTAATYTVPAMTFSTFVNTSPQQIRYNVQPVGGGTAIADGLALTGSPALVAGSTCVAAPCDIEAIPGTTIAGSAVTGILFPASVAGSNAVSFTTPGMTFMWDRRPPRPAGA